jgi:hypothetical protein
MADPPEHTDHTIQQAAGEPNPETLDTILDWVKDLTERQARDAEYLNTKALQVFTAASVLIGFAGFSNTTPPGSSPGGRNLTVTALVVVGVVAYLAAAAVTFYSIRTLHLKVTRFGATLWEEHWTDDPVTLKVALLDAIGRASKENDAMLAPKGRALKIGLLLTSLEAVLVTAAVVAARLGS